MLLGASTITFAKKPEENKWYKTERDNNGELINTKRIETHEELIRELTGYTVRILLNGEEFQGTYSITSDGSVTPK